MKLLSALFLACTLWHLSAPTAVYDALRGDSVDKIDEALASLENENADASTDAYRGTLLMKKADFLKGPGKKLKTFKEGNELLEEAIAQDTNNVEYRFLRLMIQEHAPKILNYDENIDEDKSFIIANYKKLDAGLKKQIQDYVSRSSVLSKTDLID